MVQPTTSHALGDQLIRTVKLIQAARTRGSTLVEGLDQSAYPILFTLGLEPRRMSDLADAIHSDISTVSRQVAGLRKAGYVSSTKDPDDGRAQVLTLTDEGRRIIAEARERRDAWIARLTHDWDDNEVTQFTTLLGRFADSLQDSLSA